jgi:hypothetical protein
MPEDDGIASCIASCISWRGSGVDCIEMVLRREQCVLDKEYAPGMMALKMSIDAKIMPHIDEPGLSPCLLW